jgi:amino acid transporter
MAPPLNRHGSSWTILNPGINQEKSLAGEKLNKYPMSLLDKILGRPIASSQAEEEKIGVLSGIPVLGLDGLSSSAYGPEAALTVLLPLGALGLVYIGPIILAILVLLFILYLSYRQTIAAYPGGGGSYTVARENLGVHASLLAAASLIVDYILTVAVGISAGIGALISAIPSLQPHILGLCLLTLLIVTLINLRGLRESGLAFGIPTYVFIGTLGSVLVIGLVKTVASGGHPLPVIPPPAIAAGTETVSIWLILRSFASGCTAMTGVEAVSNGVMAFKKPGVQNAQRTLTAIIFILGLLLGGIALLSRAYGIGAMDQEQASYQSIISQMVGAVTGRGAFYYVTIASVLAVLALSANTSFADFPRLCRLIALDGFLPHGFTLVGRRLVNSVGIIMLAILCAVLLIAFGGITDRLIPLYAVGAFGAFTLSQAGMVMHWRRTGGPGSRLRMTVNGVGAGATFGALIVIIFAKFIEGAWITIFLIPALFLLFIRVKHHYDRVAAKVACTRPLAISKNGPPVVVIPIQSWTMVAENALCFALTISPDVIGVHVSLDDQICDQLCRNWPALVENPAKAAGKRAPVLKVISTPYRMVIQPITDYVNSLSAEYSGRTIAVIIPELVEAAWYEHLLHNNRATWLKANLLLKGEQQVVVINVPWYLGSS